MQVQHSVSALIKGRVLVGHSIENDLRVLLLSHPKKDTRDTARYPPFMENKVSGAEQSTCFGCPISPAAVPQPVEMLLAFPRTVPHCVADGSACTCRVRPVA